MSKRCGLYCNINKRKKAGKSRSKKNSTISPKAYANMKAGFLKRKKKKMKSDNFKKYGSLLRNLNPATLKGIIDKLNQQTKKKSLKRNDCLP